MKLISVIYIRYNIGMPGGYCLAAVCALGGNLIQQNYFVGWKIFV